MSAIRQEGGDEARSSAALARGEESDHVAHVDEGPIAVSERPRGRRLVRQVFQDERPTGEMAKPRSIRLGYSAVAAEAEKAILDVFRSGQFSPGEKVLEFEKKFAKLHKADFGVFVNSGTDALRIALLSMKEAYGWKDDAEVAVPSLTFPATVNVILQANLKPYFVDVSMYDYCLNLENLKRRLETGHKEIVGIIPVHLFGQSCDPRIFKWAEENGVKVLEDSCETILNPIQGEASCYSTYMAHHVTTGVGGLALTNDRVLWSLMLSYANHGRHWGYIPGGYKTMTGRELLERRFRFERIGYSCRATEFEAALGLSQLESLDSNVCHRIILADQLKRALRDFPDLILPVARQSHTWMMFPIVLAEKSKVKKYDFCLYLEKNGIETRDMMPITNQPCYKNFVEEDFFSVAKWVNKNGFYISCDPSLRREDVLHIQKVFGGYLTK